MDGEALLDFFRQMEAPPIEDPDVEPEPITVPPLRNRVNLDRYLLLLEFRGSGVDVFSKPMDKWAPWDVRDLRVARMAHRLAQSEVEAETAGRAAARSLGDDPAWGKK